MEEPGQPHQHQTEKPAWVGKTDPRLHRSYLLKGLQHVFVVKGHAGKEALDRWLSWARRCRISAFVTFARRIVTHRAAIKATLGHNLSSALIESTNTKIRLLQRTALGFTNAHALIAPAILALGGHGRRPARPNHPLTTYRYVRRAMKRDPGVVTGTR